MSDEENVSAQPHQAEADPRISGQDANQGWSEGPGPASGQRTPAAERLKIVALKAKEVKAGFCRAERIVRRADFQRATRQGRWRRSAHFRVFVVPTPGRRRLGLTVSRKVGRAVERNRVKRRVREIFRLQKSNLPEADIVVVATPGAAQLDYGILSAELAPLLLADLNRAESS